MPHRIMKDRHDEGEADNITLDPVGVFMLSVMES